MAVAPDADLQQGLALHRQGQLDRAAQLYRRVLSREPQQLDALQMLGLAEAGLGNPGSALGYFDRAARIAPRNAVLQFNRGLVLFQLKRLAEAGDAFDLAISATPDYAKAWIMKASALHEAGDRDGALSLLDRGAQACADATVFGMQKGLWLYETGRLGEARAAFEQVLAHTPGHADALVNLGGTLVRLGAHADAVDAFDRAIAAGQSAADVHFNRGLALAALRRWPEAAEAQGIALQLAPGLAEAWLQRGLALARQQRVEEALADLERARTLRPADPAILLALANTLQDAAHLERAIATYEEVLRLAPARDHVLDALVQARMHACLWQDFEAHRDALVAAALSGTPKVAPTRLFAVADAPDAQFACAVRHAAAMHPARSQGAVASTRPRGDRLRVGYFSSDFYAHATAFLMARVFECHDRTRFDTVAFSYGSPPQDAMHLRLRRAFGEFHDVSGLADEEVARLARERGIDIAVDLKGLTRDGRPDIFAHRAAPLQLAYLGYPCTTGASCMDYLVADRTVVPASLQQHYSEKILALPGCYQATDDTRAVPSGGGRRGDHGLPEAGFVFACFNSPYKITPDVFGAWMRLLAAVPGSVLWLLQGHPAASANLRREASARGVDPARLVFAPHAAPEPHLARQVHADLFLDTLPCNAHTTASDALWMGLPLVTVQGRAFAARVASSLLEAIGLPELVTETLADYEALALALATQPARLGDLRARLAAGRTTQPLFDTQRFTRHLEAGFTLIQQRHASGLPPDHVDVPAH